MRKIAGVAHHVQSLQFVFSALVLALATYTLTAFPDWKEVRFTVAAAAWSIVSLHIVQAHTCETTPALCIMAIEFTNWAMFLAVWIALAQNISSNSNTSFCHVGSSLKPCQTIYAAFAFAIFVWILYSLTFGLVVKGFFMKKEPAHEKARPEENA